MIALGARVLLLFLALLVGLPGGAFAQASSVSIETAGVIPVAPLAVTDADYPFGSLIANEEGQTVLNLILNQSGGVRVTQMISSSGFQALDGVALTIARTRWSFQPADGPAADREVRVVVTWKLPLMPRDEFAINLPGPGVSSVVTPPDSKPGTVAPANLARQTDYPAVSIRLMEQGEAIVRASINERGTVSATEILESSGHARLDQAALTTVRRYVYEPATVDGAATASAFPVHAAFFLRSGPSDPRPLFCHDRPYFTSYDRYVAARGGRPVLPAMWFFTADGSDIKEALLLTKAGWRQIAANALSQLKVPPTHRVVKRPSDQGECWVRFLP